MTTIYVDELGFEFGRSPRDGLVSYLPISEARQLVIEAYNEAFVHRVPWMESNAYKELRALE